jgi:hypothetical protein
VDCLAKPIEFLQVLVRGGKTKWQFSLTRDEFQFFFHAPNSRIWLPPDADISALAGKLIHTPKAMNTNLLEPGQPLCSQVSGKPHIIQLYILQ